MSAQAQANQLAAHISSNALFAQGAGLGQAIGDWPGWAKKTYQPDAPWRGVSNSGITYTVSSAPAGAMSYNAAALCNKTAS